MSKVETGSSARNRIAWRLLPFLFLLYVANYLDRTNIAYATLGMKGDLGLTDSVFGTASGIFFIGYIALQIPGALLVERDVAQARVRRLTDVLDELVHAVDHEQSQSWCTTDIDTADARAALAEGEDTRG